MPDDLNCASPVFVHKQIVDFGKLTCTKPAGLKYSTALLIGTYLIIHQRQVFSYVLLDFACSLRKSRTHPSWRANIPHTGQSPRVPAGL